jgi:hypothetical protein
MAIKVPWIGIQKSARFSGFRHFLPVGPPQALESLMAPRSSGHSIVKLGIFIAIWGILS